MMVVSGTVLRCLFALGFVGASAVGVTAASTCSGHGRAASAMIQVTSTGSGANVTENVTNVTDVTEGDANGTDWYSYLKTVVMSSEPGSEAENATNDTVNSTLPTTVATNDTVNSTLPTAVVNVTDDDKSTSQIQYVALEATETSKEAKLRQDPYVNGWKVFVNCSMDCAADGGESLDCAHSCYEKLEPASREALKSRMNFTLTPTPMPTPRPTTIVEHCAGDDGCLWSKCCRKYTASCLACTVDMAVPVFCERHATMNVPGCAAAFLQEIQNLRKAQTQN